MSARICVPSSTSDVSREENENLSKELSHRQGDGFQKACPARFPQSYEQVTNHFTMTVYYGYPMPSPPLCI